MNKEEIFDNMIKNEIGIFNIDPWDGKGVEFDAMKDSTGITEYKGFRFIVSKKSGGGVGMGEFPPTIEIAIIHTFK